MEETVRKLKAKGGKKGYDPRWTPIIQNQKLSYFSKAQDTKHNFWKKNLDYLYLMKQDIKMARVTHTMGQAMKLDIDDQMLGVKLGDT